MEQAGPSPPTSRGRLSDSPSHWPLTHLAPRASPPSQAGSLLVPHLLSHGRWALAGQALSSSTLSQIPNTHLPPPHAGPGQAVLQIVSLNVLKKNFRSLPCTGPPQSLPHPATRLLGTSKGGKRPVRCGQLHRSRGQGRTGPCSPLACAFSSLVSPEKQGTCRSRGSRTLCSSTYVFPLAMGHVQGLRGRGTRQKAGLRKPPALAHQGLKPSVRKGL